MTPARYRIVTFAALLAIAAIVVTGAAVRLTGSGLGCQDWPRCNAQRFIDVSDRHGAIEQVNRLFTGVVCVAVVAAVLGSLRRTPRRRDLVWLSVGLVVGVLAQVVLGGLVVLFELHPFFVQAHMLVSMALVATAVVLTKRAGESDDGPPVRLVSPEIARHIAAIAGLTGVAIVTGTVVTGAGPHAGDEDVRRLDLAISSVARIHSITVLAAIAAMVALMIRLRARPSERAEVGEWISAWTFVAVLQGALGYTQYFSGVPALLVGIHVFGATVLWAVTTALVVQTRPQRRHLSPRPVDLTTVPTPC